MNNSRLRIPPCLPSCLVINVIVLFPFVFTTLSVSLYKICITSIIALLIATTTITVQIFSYLKLFRSWLSIYIFPCLRLYFFIFVVYTNIHPWLERLSVNLIYLSVYLILLFHIFCELHTAATIFCNYYDLFSTLIFAPLLLYSNHWVNFWLSMQSKHKKYWPDVVYSWYGGFSGFNCSIALYTSIQLFFFFLLI